MMIEGLPLVGLTQSTLLGLVFLAVLTDRLVWHKRLKEKDVEIAALKEQVAEQGKQITLLMGESVPTVNAVLRALHQSAKEPT